MIIDSNRVIVLSANADVVLEIWWGDRYRAGVWMCAGMVIVSVGLELGEQPRDRIEIKDVMNNE